VGLENLPRRTRRLTLQVGEGIDELGRFDCAVAAPHRDLAEHARMEEARDWLVDGLLAAPMSDAALWTVSTGDPRERIIRRSAADRARILSKRSRQSA
jgi:hypothetical protein